MLLILSVFKGCPVNIYYDKCQFPLPQNRYYGHGILNWYQPVRFALGVLCYERCVTCRSKMVVRNSSDSFDTGIVDLRALYRFALTAIMPLIK